MDYGCEIYLSCLVGFSAQPCVTSKSITRFDIIQFQDLSQGPWDYEGISESIDAILGLIDQEKTGQHTPLESNPRPNVAPALLGVALGEVPPISKIASTRIVVAGLSQGGTLCTWVGLLCSDRLGGIASLSGRPVARDRFTEVRIRLKYRYRDSDMNCYVLTEDLYSRHHSTYFSGSWATGYSRSL